MITGGCLCGGVRYEVRGAFLRASHCHCSRCRRHTGTSHSTQGRARRSDFRLVSGEELVRVYAPDGGGAVKAFCLVCGSSLFGGKWPEGDEITIRLGSVDGDPGIRPQFHTFVASKAPWDEITDDLPQYAEYKPD
ncbi:MAG TPA: GFA family protein [Candidatus Polarisedimenticolaceae bacterium]|nr:GFA family protein [Candidatus Polarisedimenticolaceae bacterium]